MSDLSREELRRMIQQRLAEMPPAPWIVEMREHYRRTGAYRPEDLRRLLGDPLRSVDTGMDAAMARLSGTRDG